MRARLVLPLIVVAFASSRADAANPWNLIANPQFDANANSWTDGPNTTTGATRVRDADSGLGLPLGALDMQYSYPSAGGLNSSEYGVISNCMVVAPNTVLDFGAHVKVAVQPSGAQWRAQLLFFTGTDCNFANLLSWEVGTARPTIAGKLDGASTNFTPLTNTTTAGPTIHSMQMYLVESIQNADNLMRTVWDKVYVGPPGTTADMPFVDGFESHTTAAWVTGP